MNIYEFSLWSNCGNNCSMCWQRILSKALVDHEQQDSITQVSDFIDLNVTSEDAVLLVGGEIFDTSLMSSLVQSKFKLLIDKIVLNIRNNKCQRLFCNTNFLYKNQELVEYLADSFVGIEDRLNFTTSFDFAGRFISQERKDLYRQNLYRFVNKYPKVIVRINTIMTKQFCEEAALGNIEDKILCGPTTEISLIPYIVLDKSLAPGREQLFDTILHHVPANLIKRCFGNMANGDKRILYSYKNGKLEESTSDFSDCGHSINYKKYSDSDSCFLCDLAEIMGSL